MYGRAPGHAPPYDLPPGVPTLEEAAAPPTRSPRRGRRAAALAGVAFHRWRRRAVARRWRVEEEARLEPQRRAAARRVAMRPALAHWHWWAERAAAAAHLGEWHRELGQLRRGLGALADARWLAGAMAAATCAGCDRARYYR